MDRVYTEDELAEHLKLPVNTIKYWRSRNTGPRWFRVGRHPRYREAAIQEWEKAKEQEQARESA